MAALTQKQFARLASLMRGDNLDRALALCDKMLEVSATDSDVLRTKCVCLIWQSDFEAALKVAEANEQHAQLGLERAYCLYQLNRLDDARACVAQLSDHSAGGVVHLAAQVAYRSGAFGEAARLYEKLLTQTQTNQSSSSATTRAELASNFLAACIGCDRAREGLDLLSSAGVKDNASFELEFNKACALIAVGDTGAAADQLARARTVGVVLLSQLQYDKSEIDSEVAIVDVQEAYMELLRGNVDACKQKNGRALKAKPADRGAVAVAANNLFVARGHRDLFDSYKRARQLVQQPQAGGGVGGPATATVDQVLAKFPADVREDIQCNRALILLYMNKTDECRVALCGLQAEYPSSDFASVALAALYLQQKKASKCIELLSQRVAETASSDPKMHMRLALALAQVHLLQADRDAACAVFASLGKAVYVKPGVLAAMAALMHHAGRTQEAQDALEAAVKAAESESEDMQLDDAPEDSLLQRVLTVKGEFLNSIGMHEESAAVFRRLVEGGAGPLRASSRPHALSCLVVALSHFDTDSAEHFASMLPLPTRTPSTDSTGDSASASAASATGGEALEEALLAQLLRSKRRRKDVAAAPASAPATDAVPLPTDSSVAQRVARGERREGVAPTRSAQQEAARQRRKAKKKAKFLELLKERHGPDFDPSANVPDAKRWLPRAERQGGRKYRKKGARSTGAQGAGDAAKLDAAKFDVRETVKKREEAEALKVQEREKAAANNRNKARSGKGKGKGKGRR